MDKLWFWKALVLLWMCAFLTLATLGFLRYRKPLEIEVFMRNDTLLIVCDGETDTIRCPIIRK